jgi:hypothetical protein
MYSKCFDHIKQLSRMKKKQKQKKKNLYIKKEERKKEMWISHPS